MDNREFINKVLEEDRKKETDPSRIIALEIFNLLAPKADQEASVILAGVSMVLATMAVEMGIEEEKAIYAFRRSYGNAHRRLKKLIKQVH
jgi:hypothetical protein